MKLVHPRLETQFSDNAINVLAVENAALFRELIGDIRNTINGTDDGFVLSENDKSLNLSKCGLLVFDPIEINFNDRKLLTKLYAELGKLADEKFPNEIAALCEKISELFDKLNAESSQEISWFNDSPITAFLKVFGVEINSDYDNSAERLINYLSAMINLCGVKFVAFVNLKSFFDINELDEIYKFLRYNDIFTLLFESSIKEKSSKEFRLIIDNDLCEIVA